MLLENLDERDHVEDLGIDGNIIFPWKNEGLRVWTGFVSLGLGARRCEL
jgi:hypothetical protein